MNEYKIWDTFFFSKQPSRKKAKNNLQLNYFYDVNTGYACKESSTSCSCSEIAIKVYKIVCKCC